MSRRWWWVLGGIVLLAAAAGTVALSGGGEAGEQVAEALNTAEVEFTDLVDETTYDGTLGTTAADPVAAPWAGVVSFVADEGTTVEFGGVVAAVDRRPVMLLEGEGAAFRDFRLGDESRSIDARRPGTITEVRQPGDVVTQGDVLARIDGEPVVVLFGDVPMYRTLRDLSDNMTGPDVAQLEQALTDLGYNDGGVTVDEEFTQATEEMVERWQEDIGVDESGQVTVSDVVFLPGPAQVISVAAEVGSRVADGSPLVVVTEGEALEGDDVAQLERSLVSLGHLSQADDRLDLDTVEAIRALQEEIGAEPDGMLAAGAVRFSTTPVKVSEVLADVGTTVSPGTPVVSLASPDKVVVFELPAADQGVVSEGDAVRVELPSGLEVAATVSDVAETATTSADLLDAVFMVEVTLDDPTAAADLEQAPVDVVVVSDSVEGVVAVPVSALVALIEGGYAVEVVGEGGATTLVGVEPGFFAGGMVEIRSGAVEPGDRVVVP